MGTEGVFSMSYLNDDNFGKILTWNYKNHTNYYEGSCGDIRGSAGEFYPSDRKRDSIEIFSSELCKNAILKYDEDVEINGVKGYKYSARDLFDNGECLSSFFFRLNKKYNCYFQLTYRQQNFLKTT